MVGRVFVLRRVMTRTMVSSSMRGNLSDLQSSLKLRAFLIMSHSVARSVLMVISSLPLQTSLSFLGAWGSSRDAIFCVDFFVGKNGGGPRKCGGNFRLVQN